MNQPWKGGKAKKAPYTTTHQRIPEPIKPVVQALSTRYKQLVTGGVTDPTGIKLIRRVENAICADAQSNGNIPGNEYKEDAKDGNKYKQLEEANEALITENQLLKQQAKALEEELKQEQAKIGKLGDSIKERDTTITELQRQLATNQVDAELKSKWEEAMNTLRDVRWNIRNETTGYRKNSFSQGFYKLESLFRLLLG